MGQWRGAEYPGDVPSLGWALLDWFAEVLPSPRDPSSPLVFTDEQAWLLIRWYEVHPVSCRFVNRRGVSRRSKGWGKSPLEAAKVIAELQGDVVPDGWDAAGNPVARPWGTGQLPEAWIQVAAVSEDQTDNTWSVVYSLLTENDGRAADVLRIDAGKTRCFQRDGNGRAEPVTASAGSREGQPITYATLDETHLWLPSNGGVKLAATLRRNVAKMNGRTYETTNSFLPGEGSVAEATEKAIHLGRGILLDAVEAPHQLDGVEVDEDAPDEVLASAMRVPYGDAWWIDIDRLVEDARDPDTRWVDVCRYNLNWNVKGEGKAADPNRWAELVNTVRVVADGEYVALGFDGSVSQDCTALIGCTADGFSWVVEAWERPLGATDWKVPRLAVHAAVARAFETWRIGRMLCDPPKWWTEIEQWAELYGEEVVVGFDTNQKLRFARAVDRWLTANKEGSHTHDGSDVLRRHVEAAHLEKVRSTADEADGRTLYVIVKGADGRKIDACVADVLALEAAMSMPPAPVVSSGPFFVYT